MEKYEGLEFEIISFSSEDIITDSNCPYHGEEDPV